MPNLPNMKNKKIILIVLISSSLSRLFLYSSQTIYKNSSPHSLPQISGKENRPPPSLPLIKGEEKSRSQAILEINGISYQYEITEETSVYDFMSKLRSEGKINFTEKNYTGMGKFIVSINGVKGDGNKYWIYYVNGVEAQVGVSNYKIKSGDIVSWKYE